MNLSVIIPAYNAENNIEFCVNSVLNQKVMDIEIIIVNDGSADSTGEIIDNIAALDSRVKVFHQSNFGVSYSRRKGLSKASGKYCVFLDSDDYWDENFLVEISHQIKDNELDLIMFNFKRVDSNNQTISIQSPTFQDRRVFSRENKTELYKKIAEGTELNNLVTKIFKKDIYQQKDYPDFEKISNGEDLLEVLTLIQNTKKALYLSEPWYNYRDSDNSLSNSFNINYYKNLSIVRNEVKKTLYKNNVMTKDVEFDFSQYYMDKMMDYVQKLFISEVKMAQKIDILTQIENDALYQKSAGIIGNHFKKSKNNVIYYLMNKKKYVTLKCFSHIVKNIGVLKSTIIKK